MCPRKLMSPIPYVYLGAFRMYGKGRRTISYLPLLSMGGRDFRLRMGDLAAGIFTCGSDFFITKASGKFFSSRSPFNRTLSYAFFCFSFECLSCVLPSLFSLFSEAAPRSLFQDEGLPHSFAGRLFRALLSRQAVLAPHVVFSAGVFLFLVLSGISCLPDRFSVRSVFLSSAGNRPMRECSFCSEFADAVSAYPSVCRIQEVVAAFSRSLNFDSSSAYVRTFRTYVMDVAAFSAISRFRAAPMCVSCIAIPPNVSQSSDRSPSVINRRLRAIHAWNPNSSFDVRL